MSAQTIEGVLRARIAAGMTQARLAKACGVSDKTVARAESGEPVSLETIAALRAVLGSRLDEAPSPPVSDTIHGQVHGEFQGAAPFYARSYGVPTRTVRRSESALKDAFGFFPATSWFEFALGFLMVSTLCDAVLVRLPDHMGFWGGHLFATIPVAIVIKLCSWTETIMGFRSMTARGKRDLAIPRSVQRAANKVAFARFWRHLPWGPVDPRHAYVFAAILLPFVALMNLVYGLGQTIVIPGTTFSQAVFLVAAMDSTAVCFFLVGLTKLTATYGFVRFHQGREVAAWKVADAR